jgi:dihydrofolate reductase
VDGFIATKDGGVDWLNEQQVIEGEDMGFADFLNSVDVIVMGRNSFDKVVSFGPDLYAYGDKRLIVWTRDVSKVSIPDHLKDKVKGCSKDPSALMAELTGQGYCHAYVDGGKTIQAFLKAGLIHRMSLTRIPILLGDGIPLFSPGKGTNALCLKHVSTKTYENGMVSSTYDVNYEVPLSEDGTIKK